MTLHERFVPVLRRLVDPLNADPALTQEALNAIEWALGRIAVAHESARPLSSAPCKCGRPAHEHFISPDFCSGFEAA